MKKYLFFILFITAFNLAFGQDEEVVVTSSVTGATLAEIDSPINKLEQYLFIVNQAVGQKFDRFLIDMEKINGSKTTADYHENFIKNYIEKLLEEAIEKKEIKSIDVKAFSILLGGIGREFFKEENKNSINLTPEESANSITSIILNGIKLEN